MNILLKKPLISEKSMKQAKSNEYTFKVAKEATKLQIARLISDKFAINVLNVRTITTKSKTKMQKRVRKSYQVGGFKKAVVQLKKGQSIPLFEANAGKEEAVVTSVESEPKIIKEKKGFLSRTKVRVEKGSVGAAPTTQRKVITGK